MFEESLAEEPTGDSATQQVLQPAMCGERSPQEQYFTRDDTTRDGIQTANMRRMFRSRTNHHRRRRNVGSTPTRKCAKYGCFCGITPVTTQRENSTYPQVIEECQRAFPIPAQPPWPCNAQHLRHTSHFLRAVRPVLVGQADPFSVTASRHL